MVKTTPHPDLGDSEIAEPLFPVGATLGGRYVLREELGRGGMGSVFRVFDRLLEQQVALKFPVRARGQARQYKDAMRREVVLARRVTHPAVARVYDLAEQDDLVFLTMELVRGVTLQRRLRRSPSPLEETLRIAQQVSCGLLTAHEAGVLHLDLKPGNLILAEGDIDRVKIVDFGIANVVGSRANGGGTLDYMAPEQLGDGALTGAADVYALGLLLHRMLSGQRAFDGDTPEARAMRRLERPPRPLPKSTPPALVDLVRQLLAREPAARPLMRDVAERLTKLAAASASASASAPSDPLVSRGPQLAPARYRALLRIRPNILETSALQHHLSLLADVEAHTPDLPLATAIRAAVLVRRWTMTPDQEGLDLADAAQDALQRALAEAPLLPETHLADA
ncbi:MAG: serine/threonine-protein kinase, partial [Myxococcota bacterium]